MHLCYIYIIVIVKHPNQMHLLAPNPGNNVLLEMTTFLTLNILTETGCH